MPFLVGSLPFNFIFNTYLKAKDNYCSSGRPLFLYPKVVSLIFNQYYFLEKFTDKTYILKIKFTQKNNLG